MACVALLVLRGITGRMPYSGEPPWDSATYYAMSLDPLGRHPLPFGSRWLTPALAHLLPLAPESAFELINVVGYAAAAAFMLQLVTAEPVKWWAALFSVSTFVTARYTAKWAFYLPVMVEALTHALLAAGLLFVQRSANRRLVLVASLGALQKVWVLVLIPYHFARLVRLAPSAGAWRERLPRSIIWYALPIGLFWFINWRVAGLGSYTYASTALEMLKLNVGTPTRVLRTLTGLVQSFGVALPVILADSKAAAEFLRRRWEWIVFSGCCCVLFVTGGSNLEAFASYQWPLIAILLAVTVHQRAEFWLRPRVVAALMGGHLVFGGALRVWGQDDDYLDKWSYFAAFDTVVSSAILHALAVVGLLWWRRSFPEAEAASASSNRGTSASIARTT